MKFAEHLSVHITPEWRTQYIDYEQMKKLLYAIKNEAPPIDIDPELHSRYVAQMEEKYFSFADKELAKINTFYSEKLAEATRKFAALQSELAEHFDDGDQRVKHTLNSKMKKQLIKKRNARNVKDLKFAFSEFYLSLVLLQGYQDLNSTGFRKIMKKFDKVNETDKGMKWRMENSDIAHFIQNNDIDRLINETETIFTDRLEGGVRQRAMKRLRVPPLGEHQSPWVTFKVGLFTGAAIVLFFTVAITAVTHQTKDDWRVVVRLYRGPFLVILSVLFVGINVYGWRSSGVNHVLIFDLNPRKHLSEQHIIEMAIVLFISGAVTLIGYYYSAFLGVQRHVFPLVFLVSLFAFLFNPIRIWNYQSRFWFIKVMFRIVCAPFFYVGFADFWIADQLTSLVPAFLDFHYAVCFYTSDASWLSHGPTLNDTSKCVERAWLLRPMIACLPSWIRIMQCFRRYRDTKEAFPHLANALKYFTTFFVVAFSYAGSYFTKSRQTELASIFFYLWIISSVASSCYSYLWDIRMDWGLFDSEAGDNTFLREQTVYDYSWFYYFAIVEDLILRFGWAISISLTEMGYGDLVVTMLSPLEVFRRFVWNLIRLEHEHLNNAGKFRAVRDISIAPLDSSDQVHILRMMDDADGVTNRSKKKSADKKGAASVRIQIDK